MFDQNVLNRIQVITHSGIRIDGDTVIYIDPVDIFGEPHDADLILFTHPHADHFSPKDVKKLMKDSTVIAAPNSMAAIIALRLRKPFVRLLPDESTVIAGIPIKTVAAYNKKKPNHPKAKKWLGYILTIDKTEVYVSGDTDATDEVRSVSCDIALLPVGGFYTMNPAEAAELAAAMMPHTVIPLHYGKLIGGADAAERFRNALHLLNPSIQADIRPTTYSNILASMYSKVAAVAVLGATIGFLLPHFLR